MKGFSLVFLFYRLMNHDFNFQDLFLCPLRLQLNLFPSFTKSWIFIWRIKWNDLLGSENNFQVSNLYMTKNKDLTWDSSVKWNREKMKDVSKTATVCKHL